MRKYLTAYLEQLQAKLDSKDALDYEELIAEHLRKIEFIDITFYIIVIYIVIRCK